MRSLFLADLNEADGEEGFTQLINFRANNEATIKFSSLSLACFWASQLRTYRTVAMNHSHHRIWWHWKKSFLLKLRITVWLVFLAWWNSNHN